jgi:hypothetical protein
MSLPTNNIYEALPEKISDEGAYHLVNFIMNLALKLESHYFTQIIRYDKDNSSDYQNYLQNEIDGDNDFTP